MAEEVHASDINLHILGAASAFASKDEARYYMCGVCLEIEPRAVTYVATDGHRLIAYREEKKDAESPDNELLGRFIIPSAHCKMHKVGKSDDGRAKIFGDGRLTIAYDFCDVKFMPIEGIYPDWRKTIPRRAASGSLGQFDLDLLASFKKFAAAADLTSPFVAHNGPEAPAIVWWPGRTEVIGIIMPFRMTHELDRTPPDWALRGDHIQSDIEDAA